MISILALLAVLTLVALRWDSQQKVLELEQVEARGDLRRLLATFHARTLEVNGTLKSWANWTELYDHLLGRTPQFRQDELSAKVLAVADIDFILLLDLSGQVVDMAEVPGAQGETPATDASVSQAAAYLAVFGSVPSARGCGFTKAGSHLAQVCFSPVMNSEGKGPASGYIVMGRWVDDVMVRQIADVTGIAFKIVDVATPSLGAPPQHPAENLFMPEAMQIRSNDAHLDLSYPITSLFGQKIADIQAHWPRQHAQLADSS